MASIKDTFGDSKSQPDVATRKEAILAQLDIQAEYESAGLRFAAASANAKGWRSCHRFGDDDRNPSASVEVATGRYKEFGGNEESLSLWDFFLEYVGGFTNILDVLAYFEGRIASPVPPSADASHKARDRKPRSYPTLDDAVRSMARLLGEPSGQWAYPDAQDGVPFRVVRFNAPEGRKTYRPFYRGPDGWVCGDPKGPLPLYRRDGLADGEDPVFVVEGEKCADLAHALGLTAVTSVHGALSAAKSDWSPLAGRSVVIVPDNDANGETYAADVLKLLGALPERPTVRLLRLAGLPDGGDLVEWNEDLPGQTTAEAAGVELRRLAEEIGPIPFGDEKPAEEDPPGFSLNLIKTSQFLAEEYGDDWAIDGTIVAGEPVGMGGPSKSFKTSTGIDLTISVGTGTPFLGHFAVPRRRRAAFVSGESGKVTIQATARTIIRSKGLNDSYLDDILWGFNVPQLADLGHLKEIRRVIKGEGIELFTVDPFYMTLNGVLIDQKNMFQMGPLLKGVADACMEEGATPIIQHHFPKNRLNPFAPPELSEFAFAGFAQQIRQWIMLAPRERFDLELGLFRAHLVTGGSRGQCGEYALDVEVGRIAPGGINTRKWKVTVLTSGQAVAEKQEQAAREKSERQTVRDNQKDQEERVLMREAMAIIRAKPGRRITKKGLRELSGWGPDRVGRILGRLLREGHVREVEVTTPRGKSGTQTSTGYEGVEGNLVVP